MDSNGSSWNTQNPPFWAAFGAALRPSSTQPEQQQASGGFLPGDSSIPPRQVSNGASPSTSRVAFAPPKAAPVAAQPASDSSSRSASPAPAPRSSPPLRSTTANNFESIPRNVGAIAGTHTLKKGSVFNFAVGETFKGRKRFQKKVQEIAIKNGFRINVKRSEVKLCGPCPVPGQFQLRCFLHQRRGNNQKSLSRACPFVINLEFVLEINGMFEEEMDYKVVSIVDKHNHPPVTLTPRDLGLAARSIVSRQVWLKVAKQQGDDSSDSSQDLSEGEEEALKTGPSRRTVPSRSGPALHHSSEFKPKSFMTVDWRPPAHCFRPFTRMELLSEFPRVAHQATGIEIICREGEEDLSFFCKLHKELQCRWNAVFARVYSPNGEIGSRYQLLGPGTKGSFTHSHPIDKQSSSTPSPSPSKSAPTSSRKDIPRQQDPVSSRSARQSVHSQVSASRPQPAQTPMAPRSPSSNARAQGFARSTSPEDDRSESPIDRKPCLSGSKKRAHSSSDDEAPLAQQAPVNLGYMSLEDSEDEDEKPIVEEQSNEEVRRNKQARIVEPRQANGSTSSSSRERLANGPAFRPPQNRQEQGSSTSRAIPSTAQERLERFLLSIDPHFVVPTTSPSNKLNLDFLAPLLLSNPELPHDPDHILCYQLEDAALLVEPLREAYEAGGEKFGKILPFDWRRIIKKLESGFRGKRTVQ